MAGIAKIIGERIRNQRNRIGLTQEELAERCGLHATYIGQLERGEKNATVESIEKVVHGLDITYEVLFEKIDTANPKISIASQCYSLVDALNENEQVGILEIIQKVLAYKTM